MLEIKSENSSSCLDGEKMNEHRLNDLLKNVANYQGSFAIDELDQIKLTSPTFLAVNLDERKSRGSHWIGVAVYLHNVYICDTLGGILPDNRQPIEWIYFLKNLLATRKLVMTKQLSDKGLCGLYCVTFIKEMARTNNFCDFISLFSANLSTNDTVVKFLNK